MPPACCDYTEIAIEAPNSRYSTSTDFAQFLLPVCVRARLEHTVSIPGPIPARPLQSFPLTFPLSRPARASVTSHWASLASVLRPGTFLTRLALHWWMRLSFTISVHSIRHFLNIYYALVLYSPLEYLVLEPPDAKNDHLQKRYFSRSYPGGNTHYAIERRSQSSAQLCAPDRHVVQRLPCAGFWTAPYVYRT